ELPKTAVEKNPCLWCRRTPQDTCPTHRPGIPTRCPPCRKSRSHSAGSCRQEMSCEACRRSSLRVSGLPVRLPKGITVIPDLPAPRIPTRLRMAVACLVPGNRRLPHTNSHSRRDDFPCRLQPYPAPNAGGSYHYPGGRVPCPAASQDADRRSV